MDMVDEYIDGEPPSGTSGAGGTFGTIEYVHPLEAWRIANSRSLGWMYDRLITSYGTYHKWTVPRDHKNAIVPRTRAMARIVILTGGVVEPNDFYPLAAWKSRAAGLIQAKASAGLRRDIAQETGQEEVEV